MSTLTPYTFVGPDFTVLRHKKSCEIPVKKTLISANYFDIISAFFTLLFMEKLKRLINQFVIIPVLLITGCGYVSDKPVENISVYKICTFKTPGLSQRRRDGNFR